MTANMRNTPRAEQVEVYEAETAYVCAVRILVHVLRPRTRYQIYISHSSRFVGKGKSKTVLSQTRPDVDNKEINVE